MTQKSPFNLPKRLENQEKAKTQETEEEAKKREVVKRAPNLSIHGTTPTTPIGFTPTPAMEKALAAHLEWTPKSERELCKLAGIANTSMSMWKKKPGFVEWWRNSILSSIDISVSNRLSSVLNHLLDRCDDPEADPADVKILLNDVQKLLGHMKEGAESTGQIQINIAMSGQKASPLALLEPEDEPIDAEFEAK